MDQAVPPEQQKEPTKRSVQEILDSARAENLPAVAQDNTENTEFSQSKSTRRKTIDRRSGEVNPKLAEIERRREDSDRRKAVSDARKKKQDADKEKALDLIRKQKEMKVQQHRKKKLLAGCEPVMGLNYDCLAMDDYPENALIAAARHDRDFWVTVSVVFGFVFLLGLMGLLSGWIAGISAGLCITCILIAFTPLRRYFFERPPLGELLAKRKAVEFKAINHILFLEGSDGLAWRCGKLYKFNHNLSRNMFDGVKKFSKERNLKSVLKSRKHIRMYLLFMIEAQKAYKRLQKDYLTHHFDHIESGWDDGSTDEEIAKLEQELGLDENDEED